MANRIKNKKGMALIVALLTSFILLALVASLFWVIASTSRQAEYTRNSAAALNLAEAGIADAIYRLNYNTGTTDGTDNYPFQNTNIPFGITASDLNGNTTELPNTVTYIQYGANAGGIRGTLDQGYYVVGLVDSTTNVDTLLSVGVYKGIRRILAIPLRGNNNATYARQTALTLPAGTTQGISEAFNKHAIYADTVTGATVKVKGNIAYKTSSDAPQEDINYPWTKTKVDSTLFGVPGLSYPLPASSLPALPGSFAWTYQDIWPTTPPAVRSDPALGYPATYDPDGPGGPAPPAIIQPPNNFVFNNGALSSSTDIIGSVTLQGAAVVSAFLRADNITISASGVTVLAGSTLLAVDPGTGNISISAVPSGGINGIVAALNDITITDSVKVTDDIISRNGTISLSGGTFTGPIISGGTIILNPGPYGIYYIDVSSRTNDAAIYGSGTITINSGVTFAQLKLGASQKTAILAYGSGVLTININDNLNPTYDDTNGAQAAIVAYSTGNNANVNIGPGVTMDDAGLSGKGRLIYSCFGTGGTILNSGITLANDGVPSGTVYGSLVTNGTVILTSGTLIYDNTFFVAPPTGNFSGDIYQGFSGGRRAYVPVWQGWSLR